MIVGDLPLKGVEFRVVESGTVIMSADGSDSCAVDDENAVFRGGCCYVTEWVWGRLVEKLLEAK